jgi:hypothetical protein
MVPNVNGRLMPSDLVDPPFPEDFGWSCFIQVLTQHVPGVGICEPLDR